MQQKVKFSVTPYKGYENEVVKTFNKTRGASRTRRHFDWRYSGEKTLNASPLIFWVNSENGNRVGMAGLVPRPYWIDGNLQVIWVLGDISLDIFLRRQGIGGKLFSFISSYMVKNRLKAGFVIPNEPVRRGLLSAGWNTPEAFVWYISVINPGTKILPDFIPEGLCRVINKFYQRIMLFRISKYKDPALTLSETIDFDQSFDSFWQKFPKEGVIIKDRSAGALQWRFGNHPHTIYRTYKLMGEKMLGYIVYELKDKGSCRVVDLLCLRNSHLKSMMAMFLEKICIRENINTIRIKLSSNYLRDETLRKVGFIKRMEGDVFQVYDPLKIHIFKGNKWVISIGDKDV